MRRRADILSVGAQELRTSSDSPRLDAELLLAQVLGCSRSALVLSGDEALSEADERAWRSLMQRRIAGAPVAYLIGSKEFWSMELTITPAVLVPRPETEILVEQALALIPLHERRSILDLGTGSGAIALAVARERPQAQVTGSDISADALAVAQANAQTLDLERIQWRQGAWFEPLAGLRFNLILSNPPYIAEEDPHLKALASEPRLALTPGITGLEAYQHIIPAARAHLTNSGWIAFEHGADQAEDVANLLEYNGFFNVRSHPDYSGTPRVTLGSIHSKR